MPPPPTWIHPGVNAQKNPRDGSPPFRPQVPKFDFLIPGRPDFRQKVQHNTNRKTLVQHVRDKGTAVVGLHRDTHPEQKAAAGVECRFQPFRQNNNYRGLQEWAYHQFLSILQDRNIHRDSHSRVLLPMAV